MCQNILFVNTIICSSGNFLYEYEFFELSFRNKTKISTENSVVFIYKLPTLYYFLHDSEFFIRYFYNLTIYILQMKTQYQNN